MVISEAKIKKIILKSMINIFYEDRKPRVDWMGYQITKKNFPTYHHIIKKTTLRSNNKSSSATVDNGAYLGKKSHDMLHVIEQVDHDLYECWNDLFIMINRMRIHPIDDVWGMVNQLKTRSEEVLNRSKSRK